MLVNTDHRSLISVSGTDRRIGERCENKCFESDVKISWHEPIDEFKLALKRYLLHYSFYSLEEYFNT